MPGTRSRLRDRNFDIDRYLSPFVARNQASKLPKPLAHFLGHRSKPQKDVGNVLLCFWSCLGGFISIILMEAVFMIPAIRELNPPLMIASFGAAAILQYNTIASPLAQPRNAILGEFLATALGIAITKLFLLLPHSTPDLNIVPISTGHPSSSPVTFEDLRFLAGALCVGLSSALMTLTKTVYPPAGATALLAAIDPRCTNLGWWLLPLAMLSTVVNLLVGLVINNLQRRWPVWWWTDGDVRRKRIHAEGGTEPAGDRGMPVVQGVEVSPQGIMSGEKRVSEASTVTLGLKDSNPAPSSIEKEEEGPEEVAVRIKADGIVLPRDFELTEKEEEVLGEIKRRMKIKDFVEKKKVVGDDNV